MTMNKKIPRSYPLSHKGYFAKGNIVIRFKETMAYLVDANTWLSVNIIMLKHKKPDLFISKPKHQMSIT